MLDTSVHLEQNVFPEVPFRHWICSLSWGLRTLIGYDSGLCAKVTATNANELRVQPDGLVALTLKNARKDGTTGFHCTLSMPCQRRAAASVQHDDQLPKRAAKFPLPL